MLSTGKNSMTLIKTILMLVVQYKFYCFYLKLIYQLQLSIITIKHWIFWEYYSVSVSVFYWHNITLYLQDPDADEPELPARDGSEHVAGGVSVHDLLGGDVGRRHDPVHGLLHGGARHRRHLQQGLLRRPGQPPLQVSANDSKVSTKFRGTQHSEKVSQWQLEMPCSIVS